MRYIKNPNHKWVVCIGVFYGTALWQVGDPKQQNGNYTLKLGEAKVNLMTKKKRSHLSFYLIPKDIIPLINYSWLHIFVEVEDNKKGIS